MAGGQPSPYTGRFRVPSLSPAEWEDLDKELTIILAPWHQHLSHATSHNISEINDVITQEIRTFLISKPDLFLEKKSKSNNSTTGFISREPRSLQQLRALRSTLQREAHQPGATPEARKEWRACIKAIQDLRHRQEKIKQCKTTKFQEDRYRQDFYWFAKSAIKGTLGKTPGTVAFSKEVADIFYPSTYSTPHTINRDQLGWIPEVDATSFTVPFDTSIIVPGLVKATLARTNKSSSPGPDGIRYGILFNLPSTHHIMATLFTRVLQLGTPPSSWGESNITLIHKKGPEEDPTNFRMIALAPVFGKCFHLILAKRFTNFLLDNKIIDPAVQKAFLPGISGCFEHNIVMQEIIKQARVSKKTLHLTFFDLADAFGSVPHELIRLTLEKHGLPNNIQGYMDKVLDNGWASVNTKSWTSQRFKFARGVFQGDPLSPIIFIWVFNPIIKAITKDPKLGYTIGDHTIATLPFADDFTLLTTHKAKHQKAITTIKKNIESLGMRLKPSKCRNFSLSAGKPTKIPFSIGDSNVPSIADEDQHYLGAKVFFLGKEAEVATELKNKIEEKLQNLDQTHVRNEYKLAVLSRYLIPSLRFILTVHDLTKTTLKGLDSLCDKYAKKWAGIPRSGTNIIIHCPRTLNIPSITHLYKESHALTHTSTRLKGDSIVNNIIDQKIAREGEWKRKTTSACSSEALFQKAISTTSEQLSPKSKLSTTKKKVKDLTKEDSEILHASMTDH